MATKKLKTKPIEFTQEKYNKLVKLHKKAKDENTPIIEFEGHELTLTYCSYLIEFLDLKFKN